MSHLLSVIRGSSYTDKEQNTMTVIARGTYQLQFVGSIEKSKLLALAQLSLPQITLKTLHVAATLLFVLHAASPTWLYALLWHFPACHTAWGRYLSLLSVGWMLQTRDIGTRSPPEDTNTQTRCKSDYVSCKLHERQREITLVSLSTEKCHIKMWNICGWMLQFLLNYGQQRSMNRWTAGVYSCLKNVSLV